MHSPFTLTQKCFSWNKHHVALQPDITLLLNIWGEQKCSFDLAVTRSSSKKHKDPVPPQVEHFTASQNRSTFASLSVGIREATALQQPPKRTSSLKSSPKAHNKQTNKKETQRICPNISHVLGNNSKWEHSMHVLLRLNYASSLH